jgi:hypothetical protein
MTKTDKKKSVRKTETWRQSAMKLRFIVFGIIFVLLLLPHLTWARTMLTPQRVALISSSGVNNDFRSWGEYDGQLQALGWTFDRFRNTELEKFFERAQEYDLVLTTSLWNYGDPQDMRRYVTQWQRFLEQGGILVLTDMAYAPMCDWLSDLREDLSVSYSDAARELGDERALLDTSQLSSFLSRPNRFGALNYWAHFPKWGKGYSVWARTKAGTAIGLLASVGRGILIVTTAWAFSAEMLVNLYANARIAQSGVWVDFVDLPSEVTPGTHTVRVRIENMRQQPITVSANVKLERDQQPLSAGQPVRLSLRGRQSKTVSIPLTFLERGNIKLVATAHVAENEGIEVWRPVFVPDLVELRLKRTVLVRSDKLEVSVRLSPFSGQRAKATVTICQQGKAPITMSTLTSSKRIALPARALKPGRYLVKVTATSRMERQRVEASFDVSDKKSVPTVARIGKNGELLVNGKCSVAMIPNPTADTPPQSPPHTPNIHNNTKTAMQVINHTLRQHLTTRQTQPPTTHTIPKLALDHRNHRLHLPTLTIQPARFDTLHDLRTQHARPRPQPSSTPNRRYHIRPLYIATIKPCVRQQPKPRRTPPAYHIPTCLGTQRR